jgi:hypothetical protein
MIPPIALAVKAARYGGPPKQRRNSGAVDGRPSTRGSRAAEERTGARYGAAALAL